MAFNLLQPIAAASTTVAGFVALATSGAVAAGSDNTTALTPLGAKAVYAGVGSGNRFLKMQEVVVSGATTLLNLSGGVNNYAELNLQNISNGATASSDLTVTANNGSASTLYANLGINGSGYVGSWGGSGDAYVYNSDGHLWVGSNNTNKNLILSAGNAGTAANVTIANTGVAFAQYITIPTQATTDSGLKGASTAFVQAVSQAENTYATLSITAAGDNLIAATTAQNRVKTVAITVTAGTYTATVTLQTTNALAGDMRILRVSMPVGLGNNIDVRNATSAGTALGNCPMDGATARVWVGRTSYDGSAWGAVNWVPLSVLEYVDNVNLDKWYANGYLNSDGATSNRAQIQGPFDAVNNPRGWVAGAATLTWRGVVTVPSAFTGSEIIAGIGSSSAQNEGLINSLQIAGMSFGSLRIETRGAAGSDYRLWDYNGFISIYAGKTGILEVYIVSGTTNPVVRWNEVDISSNYSLQTSGTVPTWLNSSTVPTYHITGYNWPSGPAPVGCWILGALSDADRAFHTKTGQYPAWVVKGGHSKFPNQVFFTGLGGTYDTFTGATAGAYTAVKSTGGTGYGHAYLNSSTDYFQAGQTVRLQFTATLTSGAVPAVGLFDISYSLSSSLPTISAGSNDITLTATSRFNGLSFFTSSNSSYAISGLTIAVSGAISLPGIQNCRAVLDLTTIGGSMGTLVGTTPICKSKDWTITYDTYTNPNQMIGSGDLIDSTKDVIDSIEQTTTGTPTTTIGSASAGAGYKASSALSAGVNPITLVTRKVASNQFWVGSNASTVVRTTIKGHTTN